MVYCRRPIALLLLAAAALLAGCVHATEGARVVHVIHTSDLHACLEADEETAGMLRMGAAIARLRREAGPQNVLHIDTGDTVQGTMAGALTRGLLPLQALVAMGCDAWVPGNHEFDFGFARFAALAEYMRPLLVCGNLRPLAPGTKPYIGWKMFERNGVRLAVIGMTASYVKNWFSGDLSRMFQVELAMTALERLMPDVIAAKPDAIVLAIHQGWTTPQQDPRGVNEVAAIADKYPEIDLILGGHTHRPFPGATVGGGCWYVQPGAHAQYFVHIRLYCDTKAHRVERIESVLVDTAKETTPDAALMEALAAPLAALKAKADEIIVPAMPMDITAEGLPGRDNAMALAFCKAISTAANTELALHGALSKKALRKGEPVTARDVFQIVPYEHDIIVASLTQEELEEVLTEQWSYRKHYTYCGFYGAVVAFDNEGKAHIRGLGPGRHTIAMNSFTAAGGGRYVRLARLLKRPESRMRNTGLSTRDAMRDYLKSLATP